MECQSCHSRLVADVENHFVVGLQTVVEPLYLWYGERRVAFTQHQLKAVGMLLQIVHVEVLATGVSKLQRALILSVDIRKVGAVRVDIRLFENSKRSLLGNRVRCSPGSKRHQGL